MIRPGCPYNWSVHRTGVSTGLKCPYDWSVHRTGVSTGLECPYDQNLFNRKAFKM